MYQNVPITERVQKIRRMYRDTKPKIDISRYRLVTEFYINNPQLPGILKRAKNLRNLFENMPTPVRDHELIVGHPGFEFRSSALYPEHSFFWFLDEIDTIDKRSGLRIPPALPLMKSSRMNTIKICLGTACSISARRTTADPPLATSAVISGP